jgi:hypothetical protein
VPAIHRNNSPAAREGCGGLLSDSDRSEMLIYELRLLNVAGETRKRYTLRCEDDATAKLRAANCGDLRFRLVELWCDRKLIYEGARTDIT